MPVMKYRYDDGTTRKGVPATTMALFPGVQPPEGKCFQILKHLCSLNFGFDLAATKKPKNALHEIDEEILALHCGRWIRATVIKKNVGRGRKYEVKGDAGLTWSVGKDDIRELPLNILDVKELETADVEKVLREVNIRAERWEKKIQQLKKQQLRSFLQCLIPTRYIYSQHYQSRGNTGEFETYTRDRSKTGLPDFDGPLVFIGEQNFFGTNMLGAFSATDWGMPLESEVSQEQKIALNNMCKKEFSFGRSCFVVNISDMVHEVVQCNSHILFLQSRTKKTNNSMKTQ
jgi:hypothetical protein